MSDHDDPTTPGPGHGLLRMQERAALFGSMLGPRRARRRFRVHACLPARTAPARRAGTMTIRVVLADDESAACAPGSGLLLEGERDLEVVGEAANGHAAVDSVARHRADVVLMDVRMPGTRRDRRRAGPSPRPARAARVLVLTTLDEDEHPRGRPARRSRRLPAQDRAARADARRRAPCRRRSGERSIPRVVAAGRRRRSAEPPAARAAARALGEPDSPGGRGAAPRSRAGCPTPRSRRACSSARRG